jgi:hypothetical protein
MTSVNDLVQTNKPRGETNEIKWLLPWTEKEIMEIQNLSEFILPNTIITKKMQQKIESQMGCQRVSSYSFSTHGF